MEDRSVMDRLRRRVSPHLAARQHSRSVVDQNWSMSSTGLRVWLDLFSSAEAAADRGAAVRSGGAAEPSGARGSRMLDCSAAALGADESAVGATMVALSTVLNAVLRLASRNTSHG